MGRGDGRGPLIDLLRRDALRTGTFTLASGRTSHYYVDGRKVTLAAEGAALIGAGVLETDRRPAGRGGRRRPDDGGRPDRRRDARRGRLGARPGLRGFLVRKEAKGHGTGQLVEGPVEPGMEVVIVEDVATTGGSALKAVDAAEAIGARVVRVVALLDRLEGAAAAFAARGIDFRALATIRDLGVEPLP